MAFKINFLDNTTTDYYADDFNRQMKSIVKDNGVSTPEDLKVTANTPNDLSVNVATGSAWVDGLFITSDTVVNVEIPLNSAGNTVYHGIYLIIDKTNKSATIDISNSTPETNKVKVRIAQVSMASTNTKVESGQITDQRGLVSFATSSDITDLDAKITKIINGNTKVASATNATNATNASYATNAGSATSATNATNAANATTATRSNGVNFCYGTNQAYSNVNVNFWYGTQAEYDAISSKNSNMIYFIRK